MTHPRTRSIGTSLLLVLTLGLATVLLGAGPASAHAALTGSDPGDGATLRQAPAQVTFTFNEDIADPAFLVVTAAGQRVEQGEVRVDGNEVSVDVAPDAAAGAWTAAYRVVSTDGHPVTGEIGFDVTAPREPASPTASPTPSEATSPSPGATASAGDAEASTTATGSTAADEGGFLGLHAEHLVVGGVLLVLAAGVLTWALRRRTS